MNLASLITPDIVKDLLGSIDALSTSAEERAAKKTEIIQSVLSAYETDTNARMEILKAEALDPSGKGKWRPMLMRTFIYAIGWNILVQPVVIMLVKLVGLLLAAFGVGTVDGIEQVTSILTPFALEDRVWTTIMVGIGGYIPGRSFEKIAKETGGVNLFGSFRMGEEAARAKAIKRLSKKKDRTAEEQELLEKLLLGEDLEA